MAGMPDTERQIEIENQSIEAPQDPTAEEARRTLEQLNAADVQENAPDATDPVRTGKDDKPDDPRTQIAREHSKRRRNKAKAWVGSMTDPAVLAGVGAAEKTLSEPAPEPVQAPRTMRFKIDGQEVDLPEDEVRRRIQIDVAADRRMQEANRVLEQAKAEADRIVAMARQAPTNTETQEPATEARPTAKPQAPTDDPLAGLSREEAADIVNNWQVGSSEEAVESLYNFGRKIAASKQPVDITEAVRTTLAQERELEKSRGVIKNFVDKYPGLQERPHVQAMVATLSEAEMAKDLLNCGATPEQIRATTSANLREAHGKLRRAFPEFARSPDQILAAVEQDREFRDLAPKLMRRAPINVAIDRDARAERKSGVQPQPAQRTVPSRPQPSMQGMSRHQRAIASAQKARGQTVTVTVN